jgi:hypothetical protein
MRQALQVMLEDPIHDVDVVEDAEEDGRVLGLEPIEMLRDQLVQAVVCPSLVSNLE